MYSLLASLFNSLCKRGPPRSIHVFSAAGVLIIYLYTSKASKLCHVSAFGIERKVKPQYETEGAPYKYKGTDGRAGVAADTARVN